MPDTDTCDCLYGNCEKCDPLLCFDCGDTITLSQHRDNGLCADCNRQQGTMPQPGRE